METTIKPAGDVKRNNSDVISHYDLASQAYDSEVNRQFYGYFAKKLVDELRQTGREFGSVLEIGCGSGFSTLELINLVKPGAIKAVDISGLMLTRAASKKALGKVKFYSDLDDLAGESYDLIFSSFSYHWWNEQQIRSAIKALGKNGMMALCVPARRPEMLSGNRLISNIIKEIKEKQIDFSERSIGLSARKISDDFSHNNGMHVQLKTINLREKYDTVEQFADALDVRGSLLAISRFFKVKPDSLKKQLLAYNFRNYPLEIAWKAYLVIIQNT